MNDQEPEQEGTDLIEWGECYGIEHAREQENEDGWTLITNKKNGHKYTYKQKLLGECCSIEPNTKNEKEEANKTECETRRIKKTENKSEESRNRENEKDRKRIDE